MWFSQIPEIMIFFYYYIVVKNRKVYKWEVNVNFMDEEIFKEMNKKTIECIKHYGYSDIKRFRQQVYLVNDSQGNPFIFKTQRSSEFNEGANLFSKEQINAEIQTSNRLEDIEGISHIIRIHDSPNYFRSLIKEYCLGEIIHEPLRDYSAKYLLKTIQAIHTNGVAGLDLYNHGNVILQNNGKTKLIDLGLSISKLNPKFDEEVEIDLFYFSAIYSPKVKNSI